MRNYFSTSRGGKMVCALAIATFLLLVVVLSSAAARDSRREAGQAETTTLCNSICNAPTATLVVTSTADGGYGTLRWAMQNASSCYTITFDSATFLSATPATITLLSPLPAITQSCLTIDASSSGVVLDGSHLSSGHGLHITSNCNVIKGLQILYFPNDGVSIYGASDNLIGGRNATPGAACSGDCNVISGNGGRGVGIGGAGADRNVVSGNHIGVDASGTVAVANSEGIKIFSGARENRIGGSTAEERNVVSGNSASGIMLNDSTTMSNTIVGNYIGTDISGATAIGNSAQGIQVCSGAWGNRIGGSTAGERNVISGNKGSGVMLNDTGTMSNTVFGNYIGTNASGTAAIGNAAQGVHVCSGARGNRIGGSGAGEGNLISGNHWYGIKLNNSGTLSNTIAGNRIGTDLNGTTAISNVHEGILIIDGASYNLVGVSNTIAFNGGHGVQVSGNGTLCNTVTRNSIFLNHGDGITLTNGGNGGLPAPSIAEVDLSSGVVTGTTCASCTVEVFSDDDWEGEVFEGWTMADSGGTFVFSKGSALAGPNVTATATDDCGSTSAFSSTSPVSPPLPTATEIKIGAFVDSNPPTPAAVNDFEDLSGRHLESVLWYQGWDASGQPDFPCSELTPVLYHDGYDTQMAFHLTWEPWVDLQDIADGVYDSYLSGYATEVKNCGLTLRLRFAHEMIQNDVFDGGEWYPWQDQPEKYKAAFRHTHDVFAAAGATNVEFVWCPNNYPFELDIVRKYYPGSEYVDWLCMDGYKWNSDDWTTGWFDDIFYPIYHTFVDNPGVFGDKPVMIGEFAACEGPVKPAWITNAFERMRSPDYSRIGAFYWFNTNKECDWRINSSPESLAAFRDAIKDDPPFTSHFICGTLTDVDITGTTTGTVDTAYTFTATVNSTATVPLTYTWRTPGRPLVVHAGGLSDTVALSWTIPGPWVITVTVENSCGAIVGRHTIVLEGKRWDVYLPLVMRDD
jgi:hypothetical protein